MKKKIATRSSLAHQERMKFPLHLGALGVALLLATAGCQHSSTVRTPEASAKWEPQIQAFEQSDRTNPPPARPIVFIGSSSIRLWSSLKEDFAGLPVLNRGFGGSQIADSVAFARRIVVPYQPQLVVMYAGGNDINAGKSPERVFADFKHFVTEVRRHLPHTPVAYISIAPNPKRWAQRVEVQRANHLIREFCQRHPGLKFIDVYPHMLGPDGTPKPEIFVSDQLHMNQKGYHVWREVVGKAVREMLAR